MTVDEDESSTDDEPASAPDTRWPQVAQHHYEPSRDGDLTTAIIFALADAEEVDPTEVKSAKLYDVVDVAGIEATFFGLNGDEASRQGAGSVEFRFEDYLVTVGSDGWVQVYDRTEVV